MAARVHLSPLLFFKLFDLLSLYPSRVLLSALSLSQASFFFDFLRPDTWKVFIHRFEPIHLLFVFITFLRNSRPKFPTYFTFHFDILDHAR